MKSLGEGVCELLRGVDSNEAQVSVLDRFMGEVLPNGNALGTLSASDDAVSPLDASLVVLVDRGPGFWRKSHAPQEISEIYQYNITSTAAVDAEQDSASAVDRAIVSYSFDRQEIGERLWREKLPVVERREKLIAQNRNPQNQSGHC
jgi:hypothetical protein